MSENVGVGLSALSGEEVEQLKVGSWRLDCPTMLVRTRGSSPKRTYSGAGYIFQPAAEAVAFHMYAFRAHAVLEVGWPDRARAGETLPEEAYYDLEVTDLKGRRWSSKRLIPDAVDQTAAGKVVVHGRLASISTKEVLPRTLAVKGHGVHILAFQRPELPWNAVTVRRSSTAHGRRRSKEISRNAWAFRCHGLDVLVVQGDDRMVMDVHSQRSRLLPRIEHRLVEALEFVLGQTVRQQVVCVQRSQTVETTVSAVRGGPEPARWRPPLTPQWVSVPGTNRVTSRHHRRLFERFLAHGISCGGHVHSVSGQLAAIREASSARYLDAYALTLTVAIESLAFSDVRLRVRPPAERHIKALRSWIRDWPGSKTLRSRVLGVVADLGKTRAGDILRNLVRKGVITKEQYEAWHTLRNRSAHEYQLLRGHSEQLRELVPHVLVLFYRLVFHAIGYRGPYTDYSSLDWPTREYTGKPECAT